MILDQIRSVVLSTFQQLVQAQAIPAEIMDMLPKISIEPQKAAEHGDFSTNAAMVLAKSARKRPSEIAQLFKDNLQDSNGLIDDVQIAGPGFINLTLNKTAWYAPLREALREGVAFGVSHKPNGQRVLVEFVSANPTGPLHLGHARPSFMGDAVSRLLSAAGFDVTREHLANDMGNQVVILGRTIYLRYRELFGESVELGKDAYPGAYVIDIAKDLKEQEGDSLLAMDESEWLPLCMAFGIEYNLRNIQAVLESAGVYFDSWFSEKTLHHNGKVERIVEDYRERNMLYEAEQAIGTADKVRREDSKAAQYAHMQKGGLFLKTSQFGDEEDRILVRADGRSVYLAADLAYHKDKFERGFHRIINVFGADHAGHVPRIRAGMSALGLDGSKIEVISVQIVRLIKDGQEVRFSKRSGQIYELKELLEEVGVDVARFIFLMRAANTQFDFDLDLALQQSNDNPVFYVQYGHARMATLLRKAALAKQGFEGEAKLTDKMLALLKLPEEQAMMRKIANFPQIVLSAAETLEPHKLIYYCQDVISDFHRYFTAYRHTEKVISDNFELTQARLALVSALKQTIHNALALLGISSPEVMNEP